MRAFYTDIFVLPLPSGHKFPMSKYRRVREEALARGILGEDQLSPPRAATDDELLRVHCPHYLERLQTGKLTAKEQRRLGFPWSPALLERSRRSVGGTLEASEAALNSGIGINLAGGTHHAFYDRPEGFCVFNDSIVAAHHVRATRGLKRVLIIDLDVHQGNGTAALAADTDDIFTFSMHCANNFPYKKEQSDLDIALPDKTGNDAYLVKLDEALTEIDARFTPELVIYLAGADPYMNDRYGHLALDKAGLLERDQRVISWCRARKYPLAIAMAGGYAPNIEDIVDIHLNTVSLAVRSYEPRAQSDTSPQQPLA